MTKLDQIMSRQGLKDSELAEMVSTSQTQIWRLRHSDSPKGRRLTDIWAKRLAPYLGCKWPELIEDSDPQPLISSFDPDNPEHIDPDEPAFQQQFPKDAMIELEQKAGLGDGQDVQTVYRRDGEEIRSSDAIKDDYWRFPPAFVRHTLLTAPERMIVVECNGDSMEPTLKSGERVWVDTAHIRPTPDGLYAIRDQLGGIVVKRLELDPNLPRLRIISDNPLHSTKEVAFDEINIIGKVKCSLRMF